MITLAWTWLSGWFLRLPWQVWVVAGMAYAGWWAYDYVYDKGYSAAVMAMKEKDDASVKKANDAVEALRRVCASKPDECLRDEWTRDNLR